MEGLSPAKLAALFEPWRTRTWIVVASPAILFIQLIDVNDSP